jgi:hypothetical protein
VRDDGPNLRCNVATGTDFVGGSHYALVDDIVLPIRASYPRPRLEALETWQQKMHTATSNDPFAFPGIQSVLPLKPGPRCVIQQATTHA